MEGQTPEISPSGGISVAERREQIYENINKKIAIVKALWQQASGLPVVSGRDSEKDKSAEKNMFHGVFDQASSVFPQAAALLPRYKTLKNLSESARQELVQRKKVASLSEEDVKELGDLEENDDLQFLATLESGIEGALQKRDDIRSILKNQGRSLKGYRDVISQITGKKFIGELIQVIPGRFSIHLVVDFLTYMNMEKRSDHIHSIGLHYPNTPWNFIQGVGSATKGMIDSAPDHPLGQYLQQVTNRTGETFEEVLKHEDLHSFTDGFPLRKISTAEALEHIHQRIGRLKTVRAIGFGPGIHSSLKNIKRFLGYYIDTEHGELLAELASLPHKDIPTRTFVATMPVKYAQLEKLKGQDPEVDKMIIETQKLLKPDWWKETINRLYTTVEDKVPDKVQDLDIAFALFPPSKIRHIERLVDHWVSVSAA